MLVPWGKSYDKPRQQIQKQRHYFANKGPSSESYVFSSSHVWMWELDHPSEGWAPKNWCFKLLEKILESPLDCKEIKLVIDPKGNKPWIFTGRTDAKAEVPIIWPPDMKCGLNGKDPDAGKDWGQEEKRVTENERVGWHYRLKGREFEQALGDSEGQGSLVCTSPWGHKELDTTEWLNSNDSLKQMSSWYL